MAELTRKNYPEFSRRAFTLFEKLGITSMEELTTYTESQLRTLPSVGEAAMQNILRVLIHYGFVLAQQKKEEGKEDPMLPEVCRVYGIFSKEDLREAIEKKYLYLLPLSTDDKKNLEIFEGVDLTRKHRPSEVNFLFALRYVEAHAVSVLMVLRRMYACAPGYCTNGVIRVAYQLMSMEEQKLFFTLARQVCTKSEVELLQQTLQAKGEVTRTEGRREKKYINTSFSRILAL